jgi:DNA-binding XRE family transcriptional regulator
MIRMDIRGPGTPQERRQLANAISEIVSKTFEVFENRSWITHPEGFWANIERDQTRGLSLGRGFDLETEEGRTGFEIRMNRLKSGWRQKDLAEKAGIDPSHLSLIERGKSEAKTGTLLKIQHAFSGSGVPLHPMRPKKGERREGPAQKVLPLKKRK